MRLFQGRELGPMEKDSQSYLATLKSIRQQRNYEGQQLYLATIQALLDPEMKITLDRNGFSGDTYLQHAKDSGDFTSIGSYGKNHWLCVS